MRIVFDTNVLVAAVTTQGTCSDLLDYCVHHHEVFVSGAILDELWRILETKFRLSAEEIVGVIEMIAKVASLTIPEELGEQVCRDPDDDAILATALTAAADCIITGDKDLLALGQFRSIAIVRPAEFKQYEDRVSQAGPGPNGQDS